MNQDKKGEYFVILSDDDFLVTAGDLESMGLTKIEGRTTKADGTLYYSLRSVEGVEFHFDEKTLTLEINASPSILSSYELDFAPKRPPKVFYPDHSSAFLNYGMNYSNGESPEFPSFSLTNQLGIRHRGFLFLTDTVYTKNEFENRFLRLLTSVTYDWRGDMARLTAGDFFASSGLLGSSVNLGGLGYSKIYAMDPYFIRYPVLDVSGLVSVPTEVEVYLDGMMIESDKIPSGAFELKNIYYYGGASDMEVILRDPYGVEQRLKIPFYFSDRLLKKGLHEYSYNLGFLREDFGVRSNRYSKLAATAFHRYGLTDILTLGASTEAMEDLYNIGADGTFLLANAGTVTFALSGSSFEGEEGLAGSFDYLYQRRNISARLFASRFTEDYTNIGNRFATEKTSYEAAAGLSYGTVSLGTLSLDLGAAKMFRRKELRIGTISYTRGLTRNSSVFATYVRKGEEDWTNEFFLGINYYPWRDSFLTAQYRKSKGTNTELIQAQKNPPVGEGFGFRGAYERAQFPADTTHTLNSSVQFNSRYGILRGEYTGQRSVAGTMDTYHLTASGSIAYIGDTVKLTRPVNDSFGLVKLDEIEGVRVYVNNQEIGETDSRGMLVLPDLGSYYDNTISINDGDIPIEFSIQEVKKIVSPPLRSGSCINFGTAKFQGITGRLVLKDDTGPGPTSPPSPPRPIEFYSVTMRYDEKELGFITGRGGEFYIENVQDAVKDEAAEEYREKNCNFTGADEEMIIKPGTYEATFTFNGDSCTSDITLPRTDDFIVDLGEIECRTPGHEKVTELRDVFFDYDISGLTDEAEEILEANADLLLEDETITVTLEGHCDNVGTGEYNLKLGERRALGVKEYLVSLGVDPARLTVVSYGSLRPFCLESTEECIRKNRRVHFRINRQ